MTIARGKTTPESTAGSFAPQEAGESSVDLTIERGKWLGSHTWRMYVKAVEPFILGLDQKQVRHLAQLDLDDLDNYLWNAAVDAVLNPHDLPLDSLAGELAIEYLASADWSMIDHAAHEKLAATPGCLPTGRATSALYQ